MSTTAALVFLVVAAMSGDPAGAGLVERDLTLAFGKPLLFLANRQSLSPMDYVESSSGRYIFRVDGKSCRVSLEDRGRAHLELSRRHSKSRRHPGRR